MRNIWTSLLFVLFASCAYSQTAVIPVYYCAQNGVQAKTSGLLSSNYLMGVVPFCTVTIYMTGTTTIAATTPQTPLKANANGSIPPIYAATGIAYDVKFSGGYSPNTYTTPVTRTGVMAGGGGGGGSPGGSNTDVQVNVLGSFGGYSTLTYDPADGLCIGGCPSGYGVSIGPLGTMTSSWNFDTTNPLTAIDSLTGSGTTDYVWTWNGSTGQWEANSGSAGVTSITPGTNTNCTPLVDGVCTGPVTISSTGGGGSGVQYNPSTTVYYMASSSILMNDGYSFSPGTTVGTWSCSGTTCTFNTTSAHGYTTGDYVDVSQVTGWIPDFESARQWRTNVDIFQVTVTGTTQFTVTTSTTSTFGGSGGTSYLATYWGAYQTADQPYFKGHGTFISFFSTAQNLATNFSSEVTCSAGTPSYLILQVGANDVISNGASAATVEGYLQSIWQQAHAAGCIVVEMPILNAHVGISDWDPFWITIGQIDQWIGGQGITDAGLSAGQYWDRYVGFNGSTSGIVGVNASGSIIFASHVNEAFSTQSSSWDGNGAWQAWTNETGAYWIPGQLTMIDSFAPGGPAPAIQIQTDLIYGGTPNEGTRMFLTSYGGKDGLDQVLNPGLGQSGCSELDIAQGANQAFRVCANNVDNGSGGNDFYSIEGWTGSIWLKGIEVLTHGGLVFPQLLASSGTQPLVVDTAGNVSVGSSSGSSPLTTKGDLYGYSTTNARIPVGTNTYVLTADSTQALGLKWAPAATGSASIPTCSDTSGSGTAQSCTTSPSFTPVAGSAIVYTTTTANSGTGLTLNVNSLGAKSVAKWQSTTTLAAGDIAANKQVLMTYDGTNWETTTIGNAPSGGGGSGAMTNITGAVTVSGCTVTSGVCVVGTATPTITISAIPGTYNALKFYMIGSTSSSADAQVQFNGDTGSNYSWDYSNGYGNGNTPSATSIHVGYCTPAPGACGFTGEIAFYANTTLYKAIGILNEGYSGIWNNTAAVTSLTFTSASGYNFQAGNTISIYGIQ